jgi:ATP-dependent Lon protease
MMTRDWMDMTETLLPLLPLRDIVVFPGMVVPLFVGRKIRGGAGSRNGR